MADHLLQQPTATGRGGQFGGLAAAGGWLSGEAVKDRLGSSSRGSRRASDMVKQGHVAQLNRHSVVDASVACGKCGTTFHKPTARFCSKCGEKKKTAHSPRSDKVASVGTPPLPPAPPATLRPEEGTGEGGEGGAPHAAANNPPRTQVTLASKARKVATFSSDTSDAASPGGRRVSSTATNNVAKLGSGSGGSSGGGGGGGGEQGKAAAPHRRDDRRSGDGAAPPRLPSDDDDDDDRASHPHSALATLGPGGITPEMLQTSNAAEFRTWHKGHLIGRGTYGSVYLGLLEDGSFYAVKCVELGGKTGGVFNPDELVSLSREINLMQRLKHPNLCKFKGVYYNPNDSTICMFMEYIGGGSLSALVKRFKPLPANVIRSWTRQLLTGLQYLHSQHIIHRDIKGDNLLVDISSTAQAEEAQIKLADFGAAKRLADAVAQSRTVIGTPYWMAPEVVDVNGDGKGYSYLADVWSVGCTVAEMVTGKPPWPSKTNAPAAIMMIAQAEAGPTEVPTEEATPGCVDFMMQCFERDPTHRPTVAKLLQHPWIRGEMQ